MAKKILIGIAVVAVLALFGQAGYSLWQTYTKEVQDDTSQAALEARARELTTMFRESLTNVSDHQLRQGFWFTLTSAAGEEDIFYFNVDDLAALNITDEQAAQLAKGIQTAHINNSEELRVLDDTELPAELQFHNSVYTFGQTGNVFDQREQLEVKVARGTYTSEDLFQLAYLYELTGEYEQRNAIQQKNCKEFSEECPHAEDVTIIGRVVAKDGTPVQGAEVGALSRPETAPVTTDNTGAFEITLPVYDLEKVRLGAHKRNFSDGVGSVVIATTRRKTYEIDPIEIESPLRVVTFDTDAGTITGEGNTVNEDGSAVIRTPQSVYRIPAGSIVHEDGSAYSGEIDIYVYEFNRENVPSGLLAVDVFDDTFGFAGDVMQTFGMPYLQFFTPGGEELHVFASRPLELTYQMPDLDLLYQDSGNGLGQFTESDMQRLVAASVNSQGFPITRTFLADNDLIQFPAFWMFDRRAGVWGNVGIRVNNLDGEITAPFYTINNI